VAVTTPFFALVGGNVKFGTKRGRRVVNVVPTGE